MCVWKIPGNGYLLPHVDNWDYHRQIRRYIFCVSPHEKTDALIKINNNKYEVKQGLLFQFNPAYELHEFINYTNSNWYFLGFDYWDIEKLNVCAKEKKIDITTDIFYSDGFGGHKSKCKYMSKE